MKKLIFTLTLSLLSVAFISSCGEEEKKETEEKTEEHKHTATYACPMACEGDKTYPEAGSCPVCKMDLQKTEEHDHDHDH